MEEEKSELQGTPGNETPFVGDFKSYLTSALNESLIKKSKFAGINSVDEIKNLRFESWWVENREKNMITVIFRLDG